MTGIANVRPTAAPSRRRAVQRVIHHRLHAFATARLALPVVLLSGLALRLALTPIGGFETDHIAMKVWADWLVTRPLGDFYDEGFADHLPGDLWILWVLGQLFHLARPDQPLMDLPVVVLKLVPTITDTAVAGLLFLLARRFAGPAAGLLAAALFAFSPGPVFLAGVWGQWDAVSAAFSLLALWLFLRGRPEWAFPALTYASLVKPPVGALIPLFLLATLARYVLPHTRWRRFATDPAPLEPARTTVRRAAIAVVASLIVSLVVLVPFGVGYPPLPTDHSIFERIRFAVDVYPLTTVNTFTIWWPLTGNWQPDDGRFWGVTYERWGNLLLGVAYLVILWRFWRARRSLDRALVWACLAIPIALFVLPTRGHERYLYPAVMIAALAAAIAPRLRPLVIALALSYFANMYFVYALYHGAPMARFFWFPIFANTIAWLNLAFLLFVLTRGVPLLIGRASGPLAAGAVDPATDHAGRPRLVERAMPLLATAATPLVRGVDAARGLGASIAARPAIGPIAKPRLGANTLAYVAPLLLFVTAMGLRLPNLTNPPTHYFDEQHFIPAAREYSRGNEDAHFFYAQSEYNVGYEWTHPPLGKIIIAGGILLAGNDSLGWRIMGTLAGGIAVVVAYLLALALTGRPRLAIFAAGLFLLSTLHLAMTRIGTVDAFVVLFTMSAMLAFHGVLASPPDRVAWPLVRTGALLGLGISTKWNAGYGAMLVGLAIIARVLWLGWSWWTSRDADARAAAWAGVRAHLIWVPVGMALVPAAIYLLSYIPFFVSGNGRSWDDFLRIQRSMFEYHSGVEPNHIYRSRWWEWPLGLGRMWFHSDRESDPGFVHSIYVNVNPLLAIAFVPAMVWLVWRWRRGRGAALTVMLIGFFAQWLIWAVSPRSESFIYHFLPVVPFGCIAVAVALDHLWHGNQRRRTAAVVYVAAVLIVFVFLYPLVTAQPLTEAQTDARTWFDTWWRGQWQ